MKISECKLQWMGGDVLKTKFSFSKLSSFAKCPMYFFLKYVQKLRLPVERAMHALLAGRAIHSGMETDAYAKLRGESLSTGQLLDAAVAAYEHEANKDQAKDADVDKFVADHRVQLEKFEKSGIRESIVPAPGMVEAGFEIDLEIPGGPPATIEGYTDVVGVNLENGTLENIDYKSGAKPVLHADNHIQLALEAVGAQAKTAKIVSFVSGGRQKPTCKVTPPVEITKEKAKGVLAWATTRVHEIRQAIQAGVFPKCAPECYWCSAKQCEYYRVCFPDATDPSVVRVKALRPAGSLPPADWRRSFAGEAEARRSQNKKESSHEDS